MEHVDQEEKEERELRNHYRNRKKTTLIEGLVRARARPARGTRFFVLYCKKTVSESGRARQPVVIFGWREGKERGVLR